MMVDTDWRSAPCKLWQGAKDAAGYGIARDKRTKRCARKHRTEYEQHHGPITGFLNVCHHCDTPACFEIGHLFLGTQQDNMDDKVLKGRQSRMPGEAHPLAILNAIQAAEIKEAAHYRGINTILGRKYGVHHATISKIRKGLLWAST